MRGTNVKLEANATRNWHDKVVCDYREGNGPRKGLEGAWDQDRGSKTREPLDPPREGEDGAGGGVGEHMGKFIIIY